MAHFGVVCPAATGHLNPMKSLCRELVQRGHQITFFQLLDMEKSVRDGGFEFQAFGAEVYPLGAVPNLHRALGELSGKAALEFTVNWIRNRTHASMMEVPALARNAGVDFILADQVGMEASTIAEELGVPFVTISNALILNQSPECPPFFTTWPCRQNLFARTLNKIAYAKFNRLLAPSVQLINRRRADLRLGPITGYHDTVSPLAQISQQPAEFEFPRGDLPRQFHFVGPFQDARVRAPVPFPFDRLCGKPLIYASMGTLQNRQYETFACIAEACAPLPVQLVISLGGGSKVDTMKDFAGAPIVVEYAPQMDLLDRAKLCITHAGLNTVLESLARGVPMVAIPITNDQPGVAARLAWTGAGEFVPLKKLSPQRLRTQIEKVLRDETYATNARRLQLAIQSTGGARAAADIIERAAAQSA